MYFLEYLIGIVATTLVSIPLARENRKTHVWSLKSIREHFARISDTTGT